MYIALPISHQNVSRWYNATDGPPTEIAVYDDLARRRYSLERSDSRL